MMAIRVLLDHDVREDNILLVSLLMAAPGVHAIAYAYPKVKIITAAVDQTVSKGRTFSYFLKLFSFFLDFHILPGLGNFGDRYFGTDASETMTGIKEECFSTETDASETMFGIKEENFSSE
mgnify:CR=1 FL=1